MTFTIMENGNTKIVCSKKEYAAFTNYLKVLMRLYGGKKVKQNSKYIHFEIFADMLNDKKRR